MRFFITSRDMSPEEAIKAIRSHWAIENGLHWVLDVCFAEDQSRVRTENAAENLTVIRHLAHGLLRRHTADTVSVAKRRELCLLWRGYLEFVLGSACDAPA
jgi:predicted transposase YbfD/YdcC